MKTITFSKQFKKSMKDVRSYGNFDAKALEDTLNKLAQGEKLPVNYHDHQLAKNSPSKLKGYNALHLSGNLVVVYRMTDNEIEVVDIGKHNKTRLTSSLEQ